MRVNRRTFLGACAAAGAGYCFAGPSASAATSPGKRQYNLSISIEALEKEPERLEVFAKAGGTHVWLPGFFYGYWPMPLEKVCAWRKRAQDMGLDAQMINIPLGHPGDSLGSSDGDFPLTGPKHWKTAQLPDGQRYAGTSLHAPAADENVGAIKEIATCGVTRLFVDDDFRLARGPGMIGGCFCDEHKAGFLKKGGYAKSAWAELLDCVERRNLSPILRAWVEYTCDQLTGCFRAMQAATPTVEMGNMIMYFGAEKAGIRLTDYRGVPFRVGEMMFNDAGFGTVKGKTDELYSCLFHRRFTTPELAYSETTAYPSDQLSAANMAAKLAVSTIADVRNTMFMSGLTPFPMAHWNVLAPAMRHHAKLHEQLAGHTPRGPFKHYWGEASRYVGNDQPFSLCLASGVPFEVIDAPPQDGWVFLSDADAKQLAAQKLPEKTHWISRIAGPQGPGARVMEESLENVFALKHEIAEVLKDVPYVVEDKPVVCAWYPTANAVLLWNLSETREKLTVRLGTVDRTAEIDVLGADIVELA